ncbi:MAG: hypothetical protein N2747_09490 [Chitinophagaceae bacterium]|nr:hypothetical protein [Chitinophagaceae bacterium]
MSLSFKKNTIQISVIISLLTGLTRSCNIFCQPATHDYSLYIQCSDHESRNLIQEAGLKTKFSSRFECEDYIQKIPGILQRKGYLTASVDSVRFDSLSAYVSLYAGERYQWAKVKLSVTDNKELSQFEPYLKNIQKQPIDFTLLDHELDRILRQLENTGYPFAKVYFDSVAITGGQLSATLRIEKGPAYRIDSLRIYGNARISKSFLRHYLSIQDGSHYQWQRLAEINKKLNELPFIEQEKPFDLTLLATGAIVNLYLKPKKSSQANVLVGFLPNNQQLPDNKLLITGEANILLRNAFGDGETLGMNWQRFQVESPRLNLLFQYPYLFRSPWGLDFQFDMLRKDSSFINIQLQAGTRYIFSGVKSGTFFFQMFQTIVNDAGIPTAQIIQTRRLPDMADLTYRNLGLEYEINQTDYRFNPLKGYEWKIHSTFGSKTMKKNDAILRLKDPNEPNFDFNKLYDSIKLNTYQIRLRFYGANYFPMPGRRSTLKTALHGGVLQSSSLFRNELFQIGGIKLLRGFDEESQYLSHFALGTLEFRYLTGRNSFLYAFTEGGWGKNQVLDKKTNYTYFSTGAGLTLETKAGIFHLAWAVGRRNDAPWNLRQSKIHFAFVNYF